MAVCRCRCHRTLSGDFREASHNADFWKRFDLAQTNKEGIPEPPETTDPLAAVFACTACQNAHVAALIDRIESPEKTEWVDPGFPPPGEAAGDDQDGN